MDLTTLGWSADWESALATEQAVAGVPGRVIVEDKHAYLVATAEGTCSAVIRGKMLHRATDPSQLPKVGDWVVLQDTPTKQQGVIRSVLPRRTQLVRKEAGRRVEEQVLAANVDLAFIVMALDRSYNLRRLERFLVMAREGGVVPVAVLNKADLASDHGLARELEARQVARDAEVVVVSARTGHGMKALERHLEPGRSVAFIGTSGVGKSSLINRLYGEEIQATLEVRETDARGRHSTTWRELIVLPRGGVVIDTPGMREFHMWVGQDGLEEAFPDVEAIAVQCHFRNCSHTTEQRCAVLQAVNEGRLSRGRYTGYLKLKHELEFLATERREHTFQGRKTRRPSRRRLHPTRNQQKTDREGRSGE
jgi:ribosome biogenesis GTPase